MLYYEKILQSDYIIWKEQQNQDLLLSSGDRIRERVHCLTFWWAKKLAMVSKKAQATRKTNEYYCDAQ